MGLSYVVRFSLRVVRACELDRDRVDDMEVTDPGRQKCNNPHFARAGLRPPASDTRVPISNRKPIFMTCQLIRS